VLLSSRQLEPLKNNKPQQQRNKEQQQKKLLVLKQIVLLMLKHLTSLLQSVHRMFVRVCRVALVVGLFSPHLVAAF
jgi:hypothetical protein